MDYMLKRFLDIIVASIVLLTSLPLFFVIGAIIKFESHGPIIFVQHRVGRNGKLFSMYKFRKFADDCQDGPGVTVSQDPRMTKIGKILERLKMDELPQFVNVLFGHMSIVGPRPETPRFARHFSEKDREVLKVRPGIFGINQLLYRREADLFPRNGNVEMYYIENLMPNKCKNDIEYIRTATILTDAMLMGRCAAAVISEPVVTKWKWLTRDKHRASREFHDS
jgi:lipopolysaccharide/colanic/teichoic acid biosynthesis glycosyltransferase